VYDPDDTSPANPDAGECFRINQTYVQYQIPPNARNLAIIFIHGAVGTGRVWETTPDGREGFRNIFLRLGYPVYTVDRPNFGRAGLASFSDVVGKLFNGQFKLGNPASTTARGDQDNFYLRRFGETFPTFFANSQFPQSADALEQFQQTAVPQFGGNPFNFNIGALLQRTGPAILVTHSMSGIFGWPARWNATTGHLVQGVITFEGAYVFPNDDVPPQLCNCANVCSNQGSTTTPARFATLTQIPIMVIYGDNQPDCPVPNEIQDGQQLRPEFGRSFVDALNDRAGSLGLARFLWTKEAGIEGNTHFLMMDLNNAEIADLMFDFMKETGLDKRGKGNTD
jgi:hypothetical protein